METVRSLRARFESYTESLPLPSTGQSKPWPTRFKGKETESVCWWRSHTRAQEWEELWAATLAVNLADYEEHRWVRKISKNAVVFKSRLWFHHRHRHRCGAVAPHLLSGGAGTTATIPRCVIYLEGRDERGPRHNCLSIWWICLMFLFSGRTLRARCEVTNNWLNNGYLLMNGNGRKLLGSRNHGKKVV